MVAGVCVRSVSTALLLNNSRQNGEEGTMHFMENVNLEGRGYRERERERDSPNRPVLCCNVILPKGLVINKIII